MAADRRRLKLFLSLYRYHRQISNAYQKKVCLIIIQIIRTRKRRMTCIFHKLIKEVINLVKLLEKKDRKRRSCQCFTRRDDGVLTFLSLNIFLL